MRYKQLTTTICLSAAVALLPAVALAGTVRECAAGRVTPASYTWNFRQEANHIFAHTQSEALRARSHAVQLKAFDLNADLDWRAYGDQLSQLKSAVNQMSPDVCRLETIRRVLAPWQQHSVDRIAATLTSLASNTEDAITFLNAHQETLWAPTFERYVGNIETEAETLAQATNNTVEYAKVGHEYRQLKRDLTAHASS